jgi:hypothetical protein
MQKKRKGLIRAQESRCQAEDESSTWAVPLVAPGFTKSLGGCSRPGFRATRLEGSCRSWSQLVRAQLQRRFHSLPAVAALCVIGGGTRWLLRSRGGSPLNTSPAPVPGTTITRATPPPPGCCTTALRAAAGGGDLGGPGLGGGRGRGGGGLSSGGLGEGGGGGGCGKGGGGRGGGGWGGGCGGGGRGEGGLGGLGGGLGDSFIR